ncbi:Predicted 3'-5' exonuclease [Phaffia rhodozyma]|uniref:Predicted 3'-5' exonuclease n=1 Tax=Phaffia rhodozyma TaxID=264483 RepID=A0A0F7SSJ7_PHARH|nr:Predicted 3'-5' exonuclease [Phaffia rhodozyma]
MIPGSSFSTQTDFVIDLTHSSPSSPITRPRAIPVYTSSESRLASSPIKPYNELSRPTFNLQPSRQPIGRSTSDSLNQFLTTFSTVTRKYDKSRRKALGRTQSTSALLKRTSSNMNEAINFDPEDHPVFDIKSSDFGRAPSIIYSVSPGEVDDLVGCFKLEVPLSFDMEWPVSYRKGCERKTALLQIGDGHIIVLCQISAMYYKIPPRLLSILSDPNRIKVGVNIRGDALKLKRDFGVFVRGFVDISHLARSVDPIRTGPGKTIISLQNLTNYYITRYLPKSAIRTSNWTKPLSQEAIEYAAADVHSATLIVNRLKQLFHEEWDGDDRKWVKLITSLKQDLKEEEVQNQGRSPRERISSTQSSKNCGKESADKTKSEAKDVRAVKRTTSFVSPQRAGEEKDSVTSTFKTEELVMKPRRTVVLPKGRIAITKS